MVKNKITIKKSITIYENHLNVVGKANTTIEAYANDMFIFYNFIKIKLNNKIAYTNQIKIQHLELYKEYLRNDCKYQLSTASRKFNCLRHYLKYLNNLSYINPEIIFFLNNDKFGNSKKDKFTDKIKLLSDETVKNILIKLENSNKNNKFRDNCIIRLLIFTGMRRSEILNLQWKHLNLSTGELTIFRPKSSTVDTVQLCNTLIYYLTEYRRINYSNNAFNVQEYIFTGKEKDKTLSKCAYNNLIKIYTKEFRDLDGNKITGHTFRHTFITNCIRNDIPLPVIQRFVGVDLLTLQYYTHLVTTDTKPVNETLEKLYA